GLDGALYTQDMRIAKVDQKIRSRARQTYVLADSTKIGKTALTRHGFLQQVEALITDSRIRDSDKSELESKGATVIVAP
ncbi:MAG TPA: transcriptional regulator, partial [Phycisphaerales bacterium]|nr:transcriptional regulator [Phycisphaerales bacterium]